MSNGVSSVSGTQSAYPQEFLDKISKPHSTSQAAQDLASGKTGDTFEKKSTGKKVALGIGVVALALLGGSVGISKVIKGEGSGKIATFLKEQVAKESGFMHSVVKGADSVGNFICSIPSKIAGLFHKKPDIEPNPNNSLGDLADEFV